MSLIENHPEELLKKMKPYSPSLSTQAHTLNHLLSLRTL
jgi:hypothetical protein